MGEWKVKTSAEHLHQCHINLVKWPLKFCHDNYNKNNGDDVAVPANDEWDEG